VLVIPDFIANAGGVICAAMEYRGATRAAAFDAIEEKIRANTSAILEAVRATGSAPRRAAVDLAIAQVKQAMSYRRFSIL
jgi:glutamate dehydrogenase (NAD(P)+)